ncbi:CAF1 family ribonuclease [Aspergillus heteromorphus CBS 117.55]|uniref:Large ribosomal subunit protein mL46 n=1 Tax=Aspergillus heteromorphus CBS 117.55 TaxID=1448321 RepID=A0A317V4D3_9EURO|nr:CAF1 family ribonuclease [Aspergillus heteromorphus CBS 117.55]PWY69144.1 CAF1 family ribonuclease [Aspergillus heteromorphus CBS 117.55]
MDVTAQTFYHYLPGILDDLASSCFVSIDFEFSGIANGLGKTQSKKSTLQERYDEVKRSADKYQILQVGLTIAIEGPERAMYTLKPYNIYLSPIIDRRLDLERNVSFQSSAMQFLLENHFSMDTLYTSGVVYLSRDEEEQILENAAARRDRSAVHTSLDVEETETESIAFLAEVRRLVDDWLALHDARGEYLNIPPPSPPTASKQSKSMPSELNRFQKRLVHQLIEVEYPSLVTVSKPTFIQIIIYDEKREEAVRNQKMQWVQDRIRRQTGFRWIAEALVGGDLTNLEPFLSVSEGMPKSRLAQKEFLDRAKLLLQYNRPVLVGHNLFTDLIYFYRCFFGPLPDRVEHFQYIVHRLFPVLIDTKYMATHDCGSINPRSSLQETNDSLAKAAYPLIVVHEQHSKYDKEGISHEAGYDSLLTARVFIKLSAQLRDVKVSGATATDTDSQREPSSREPQPVAEGTLPRPRQSKKILMFGKIPVTKPLETVEDDSHYPSALEAHMMLGRDKCAARQRIVDQGHLIPRLGTEFWEVYGNKLRVFGPAISDARVCRSCRRNYASAVTQASPEPPSTASSTFPVVKPAYMINAGVVLSRPPQITRDLTDFEKSYHFYQKRLNERLTLPFTKYFYFKRGTPADEDWKQKIRDRRTPARDIGKYDAYSKEAWNDELLVGAPDAEPAHQVEMLVQDAESTVNATSQDTSKQEEIPRPYPRVTEADTKGDLQSLNRALQRTLYLLVQSKEGYWKFPSSPVEVNETLRQAAERTLAQSAGVNMNTWMVGYHPVGHHVYSVRNQNKLKSESASAGDKTFFLKSRIMAGQADLAGNSQNLADFKWLAKEEIAKFVRPHYYASIKNMLAER